MVLDTDPIGKRKGHVLTHTQNNTDIGYMYDGTIEESSYA